MREPGTPSGNGWRLGAGRFRELQPLEHYVVGEDMGKKALLLLQQAAFRRYRRKAFDSITAIGVAGSVCATWAVN